MPPSDCGVHQIAELAEYANFSLFQNAFLRTRFFPAFRANRWLCAPITTYKVMSLRCVALQTNKRGSYGSARLYTSRSGPHCRCQSHSNLRGGTQAGIDNPKGWSRIKWLGTLHYRPLCHPGSSAEKRPQHTSVWPRALSIKWWRTVVCRARNA
jgi:hypothetical protein